ncbi:MAG: hypothetical protein RLZZ393_1198 [Pseudomonadota bacterium]
MRDKRKTALAFGMGCLLAASIAMAQDSPLASFPDKHVWFGDLHLHTSNSYDAAWASVKTTPRDAYRYAQGYPVDYFGHQVKRKAPLDFLAVSDHAEYMGVAKQILDKRPPFEESNWFEQLTAGARAGFQQILRSGFYGEPVELKDLNVESLRRDNWKRVIDVANEFNQPGKFTTFAAFEWSNTPGGSHFHRVVIFHGPQYPDLPYSALDSRHPEDLWRYADAQRAKGIDSVLIPHNSNLSGGLQFAYTDSYGRPIDREFAETKARNERLAEVTQIKGTSETHPELSPNDEFAGFEILEHYAAGGRGDRHGSYVREALGRGLEIGAKVGVNPYALGMTGSSDYHSATSATEEDNFTGALGDGDLPFGDNLPKLLAQVNQVVRAPQIALSASGITGVWAETNTRDAIFAALKRREVFATSGPRMQVRLFGGWRYPAGLVKHKDWVHAAYAGGVPMGGNLKSATRGAAKAPRLVVQAMKDPDGANLDRIQLIKVSLKDGKSQEKVFDVAWSGNRRIDPKTGKLPAVGSTVVVDKAQYTNTIGAAQLAAEWTDPEFDPAVPAVYYARVIEIPTPRWPTYLAVRAGLPVPTSVTPTLQERAWTSPVFYDP